MELASAFGRLQQASPDKTKVIFLFLLARNKYLYQEKFAKTEKVFELFNQPYKRIHCDWCWNWLMNFNPGFILNPLGSHHCRKEFWNFITRQKRITLIQGQNWGMDTLSTWFWNMGSLQQIRVLRKRLNLLTQLFSPLLTVNPTVPMVNLAETQFLVYFSLYHKTSYEIIKMAS